MALALVLAAFAAAGPAVPVSFSQSSFVLAGTRTVAAPAATEQKPPAEDLDGRMKVQGPAWTYRTRAGAVLEVAAMGGEIREAPRLAHVAFSWKF